MNTTFVKGDVLLYFNKEVVHMVILEEIQENYFIVITFQDDKYQYGFKIKIRNLTEKNFLKIDKDFLVTDGVWELSDYDNRPPNVSRIVFKFDKIDSTTNGLDI